MPPKAKIAISVDFLNAFAALPRGIQGKVMDFMTKFRNNPTAQGIHYEKLHIQDKKMYSVRIDDTYRGIIVRQPETGVYLLLWVDHHDEAYDWAKNKKCEVNPIYGSIQLYDTTVIQKTSIVLNNTTALFSKLSDKDLIELSLPESMIPFARSILNAEDFYTKEEKFPISAFEALKWVVEGFDPDEVKELIKQEHAEQKISDNFAAALNNPETLRSFVVIETEEELRQIMAEPLEKWRVFLHPSQRKIVNRNYSGAARVLGSAGTGKTVVAMHRAKHLASTLGENERILFTTYTANLASDIMGNLKKICTASELNRIDVINLDAWVSRFLREHEQPVEMIYNDRLTKIWTDVVATIDPNGEFPVSFYENEYNHIVVAQEAFSLEKYIKANRIGRGTRLDRKKRIQIWRVFEAYQNALKAQGICDINTAMYKCCRLLADLNLKTRYKHVIVDEGQDFSLNAFRLLRTIAGQEHENDMFIVGDAHQRIYKNRAVLSQCGINIKGRSSILRINYRTTEEIRKTAFALLNGVSFDDLDGGFDTDDRCQSLTHGEFPQIHLFDNADLEFKEIFSEIKRLINGGVSAKDICIVARTHKLLDSYIKKFTQNGLRSYEIKGNNVDDRNFDGIRVATMHRVKGIEFQYVFIVSANKKIIPLTSAIDDADAISEQETITAEKCLLYVALTRAQKGAYISGYGQLSDFLKKA